MGGRWEGYVPASSAKGVIELDIENSIACKNVFHSRPLRVASIPTVLLRTIGDRANYLERT
jgi:hypothetical protein